MSDAADTDFLSAIAHMMGFPDPYDSVPPLPPDFDVNPSPVGDVVPIADDSIPEPDDEGMFGIDGSYVGSYGSVHDDPAAPPAPAGGDDVVPIAGDTPVADSDSVYQNIDDLGAPQPPSGSDSIYQAVDDVVGGSSTSMRRPACTARRPKSSAVSSRG